VPLAVVPALVAAGLLAMAGAMKVVDPTMTVGALRELGFPVSPVFVRLLAAGELAIGVIAIVQGGVTAWATVAASYVVFTALLVMALRFAKPIGSCGCFGRADTAPHWVHVVINVALWGAVVGWVVPLDRAPIDEIADHPAAGTVAVAAALVLVAATFAAFTRAPTRVGR